MTRTTLCVLATAFLFFFSHPMAHASAKKAKNLNTLWIIASRAMG